MDDVERARMVRRYEAGASIAEVAEEADVSPATARTELIRGGAQLRRPGRPSQTTPPVHEQVIGRPRCSVTPRDAV